MGLIDTLELQFWFTPSKYIGVKLLRKKKNIVGTLTMNPNECSLVSPMRYANAKLLRTRIVGMDCFVKTFDVRFAHCSNVH